MSHKYGSDNDSFCYPDTSILINKLNIKTRELLEEAEKEITTFSANEIDFSLPPYNLIYWQSIHKSLFSDIYRWAGELRSVFITKGETQFCNPKYISTESNKLFKNLSNDNFYVGLNRKDLIENSAELFIELNIIHPFREGHGRSQRILFDHIYANCGYEINWHFVSTENWIEANIEGIDMNYKPMIQILSKCLSKE